MHSFSKKYWILTEVKIDFELRHINKLPQSIMCEFLYKALDQIERGAVNQCDDGNKPNAQVASLGNQQ